MFYGMFLGWSDHTSKSCQIGLTKIKGVFQNNWKMKVKRRREKEGAGFRAMREWSSMFSTFGNTRRGQLSRVRFSWIRQNRECRWAFYTICNEIEEEVSCDFAGRFVRRDELEYLFYCRARFISSRWIGERNWTPALHIMSQTLQETARVHTSFQAMVQSLLAISQRHSARDTEQVRLQPYTRISKSILTCF